MKFRNGRCIIDEALCVLPFKVNQQMLNEMVIYLRQERASCTKKKRSTTPTHIQSKMYPINLGKSTIEKRRKQKWDCVSKVNDKYTIDQ